ncbi:MAG: hypothetical protein QXK12_03205 [Candidatus Nezhaarchaeales archaeon]
MKRELNLGVRDNVTATQLARTGRYKYLKHDFDSDAIERLKTWFLAYIDEA